jgi:hypothetical protein
MKERPAESSKGGTVDLGVLGLWDDGAGSVFKYQLRKPWANFSVLSKWDFTLLTSLGLLLQLTSLLFGHLFFFFPKYWGLNSGLIGQCSTA